MSQRAWNTYAMSHDAALVLAERLNLSGATHFEPSSIGSLAFEDQNDAFAFVLAHRGAYELNVRHGNNVVIVDTPVENLPVLTAWVRRRCGPRWLATEWVQVCFTTDAERHRFEAAI